MLLSWLLLQASAVPPPIRFDLAAVQPKARACGAGANGEIVVCARDDGRERVTRLPEAADPLPTAETGLFGKVRGGVTTRQRVVGGFPSNAAMATIKVPF